ncbi:MAG: PAS domain S-box protein [Planctomycetales bacterium]|nr:PAS domain S-box protein [Planctomycetales bacterium]
MARSTQTTAKAKSAPKTNRATSEFADQISALRKSQAVIEFDLDGMITYANDNFLQAMGYTLDEIKGRHHRIFCDPEYVATPDYRAFWEKLNNGEFQAGEFCRFGRDGREIWIQASYNPILDKNGKPYKVVKFASDISAAKQAAAEADGQVNAILASQAVIEFDLQGNILTANDNFLNAVGYSLEEIEGKHHSLFVDANYANSQEYRQFWEDLRSGKFQAAEYKRFGKGGKEIWIQASYNPIFDPKGRPFKVIKYATDITAQKVQAEEAFLVQSMMTNMSGSITFADKDGIVQFMNPAAVNLLRKVEKHLPVRAEEIVGQSIDRFHKNPAHQRGLLADSKNFPMETDVEMGDEIFHLTASRIEKEGEFLGTLVSWECVTDKVAAQKAIQENAERERQAAEDLNRKVAEIVEVAQKVAKRDYSQQLTVCGDDPIGQLGEGLSQFFEDKHKTEIQEQERSELERAEAAEQQRKVACVLELVNAVADGNFDIEVPNLGTDAVGQVASALSSAIDSMKTALTEVRGVAATVATAAEQLTAASRDISNGAQEQASSLEETASSLEEITSTVKQNTDNAQQARQLATGSRDVAEKGGEVVGDAVDAMSAINQSSKKIADIITTIDEIAFQTNLLALNAAVEAARAGEQGRGFAVVAAEVRNLAQRSASAAKEIKSLIQDSVRKVENGTELVNKSGHTLNEIVSSVKRVTDIVAEIAAASKEQLTGVEQVNKAVSQMDRVTQSNASQTEEMSGTAESLLSHAQQLRELVAQFRLGKEDESRLSNSRTTARVTTDTSSVYREPEAEFEVATSGALEF